MPDYPEIGTIFTSTPPWEFDEGFNFIEYFYTEVKEELLGMYEYYREEYPGKGHQAHELWCQLAINDCLTGYDREFLSQLAKGFLDYIR